MLPWKFALHGDKPVGKAGFVSLPPEIAPPPVAVAPSAGPVVIAPPPDPDAAMTTRTPNDR